MNFKFKHFINFVEDEAGVLLDSKHNNVSSIDKHLNGSDEVIISIDLEVDFYRDQLSNIETSNPRSEIIVDNYEIHKIEVFANKGEDISEILRKDFPIIFKEIENAVNDTIENHMADILEYNHKLAA